MSGETQTTGFRKLTWYRAPMTGELASELAKIRINNLVYYLRREGRKFTPYLLSIKSPEELLFRFRKDLTFIII